MITIETGDQDGKSVEDKESNTDDKNSDNEETDPN